jgi:uncharacterized protein
MEPSILAAQPNEPTVAPIDRSARISAIDALRGFALLGILLMNIIAMAMYGAAYDDPTVTGGATGANLWIWSVMHVLAEGKMRCLFSLVFGASVLLLTSRLEADGRSAADIYYRRTLWLLLFGVVHAYLLWEGDILYPYALFGLALYPFRKLSAKALMIIGVVILVFTSAAYIGLGFKTREMLEKGRAAVQASEKGQKLTDKETEAKADYERWRKFNRPTAGELNKDAAEWRGNPLQVIGARAKVVSFFHGKPYYHPFNWDIWSMMLIGMALLKMKVLTGQRSMRFYTVMALTGYGIGIPLNTYTASVIIKSNFDPVVHSFANSTYDVGRLSIALGHLGMIMIVCKAGWMKWLTSRLAAIGQMAFSNYIFHSVVTAFIFTGYGFKLYGTMQRYQVYYVVAAIWVFQLVVSKIWLQHFRFGPLEWCWRSLTYWKRQPMRIRSEESIPATAVAAGTAS